MQYIQLVVCGLFLTVKFSCLFTAVAVLAWQLLKVSIMLRCKTLRFKTLHHILRCYNTLRHFILKTNLILNIKILLILSSVVFTSKSGIVITELNTSWCVRSSAHINWPVRGGCVCDRVIILRSLSIHTCTLLQHKLCQTCRIALCCMTCIGDKHLSLQFCSTQPQKI